LAENEYNYLFDENCDFAEDAPQIVNHARCYNGESKALFQSLYSAEFYLRDGNIIRPSLTSQSGIGI